MGEHRGNIDDGNLRSSLAMFGAVLALGIVFLMSWAGTAHAAILPSSVELEEAPYSVSWPDSPKFEMRVKVTAGPEGADFFFRAAPPGWGVSEIDGSSFSASSARLDGPGEVREIPLVQPMVLRMGCSRGARYDHSGYFRLLLPKNSSTTVVLPLELTASPVESMDPKIFFDYGSSFSDVGRAGQSVEVPVAFNGEKGSIIQFRVAEKQRRGRTVGGLGPVRFIGKTIPAVPGAKIRIQGRSIFPHRGKAPAARWFTMVTRPDGSFASKPYRFQRSTTWSLVAKIQTGGKFEESVSCLRPIQSTVVSRSAVLTDLIENTFSSVSVMDNRFAPSEKIKLRFDWKPSSRGFGRDDFLVAHAGCNKMSGRYWLKKGRLYWSKQVSMTKQACKKPVDRWLHRNLTQGMRAQIVRRQLILTNKRGLRITLRSTRG